MSRSPSCIHSGMCLVVLTACGRFSFEKPDPPTVGSDATADSPKTVCPVPVIFDEFDDGVPCTTWANPYANFNGTVDESSGQLHVRLNSTPDSNAGCVSDTVHTFGTITVEVSEIARGANVYTMLQVHGALEYEVGATGDGLLRFQNQGGIIGTTTSYDGGAHHWRMRAVSPGSLIGEYSVDGQTWIQLGSVSITLPATATIQLAAGVNTGAVTGGGTFERLLVCP